MNLYIRYFDREVLVHSVDEAVAFLSSIPEIGFDDDMEADLRAYASSDIRFPKRYKVRQRAYFIVIKTVAATMADFKRKRGSDAAGVANSEPVAAPPTLHPAEAKHLAGASKLALLMEERYGWYEGHLDFKRMVQKPQTTKFEYRDTHVAYRCKAKSGMDCYNRIVAYVKPQVNYRSQFPSAKGTCFTFTFLGTCK